MSQTAKIIKFEPRPKRDPRDDKYEAARIDTEKTVVVKQWLLEALLRQHHLTGEYLELMLETRLGGAA